MCYGKEFLLMQPYQDNTTKIRYCGCVLLKILVNKRKEI